MGSSSPVSRQATPQEKMQSPLVLGLALASLLCLVPSTDSTFAIPATTAAGATILSLTAAQVSAIAAVGILVKAKALLAGYLLTRNRGKREAKEGLSLSGLAEMESEHCIKRTFCYSATGLERSMAPINLLLNECSTAADPKAWKLCEAASLVPSTGAWRSAS